jgi:hypothetical protein
MGKRANSEGSVYQRKDGRWVASISLENGKRKTIYSKTQREALKEVQRANHAKDQGIILPSADQTLGVFLKTWLEDTAQLNLRERTYIRYRELMNLHDVLFIRSLRGPGYLLSGSTTCVIRAQHCSSRLVFIRRLCRRFWAIRRCHSHLIPTHMCFHRFRKRRSVASMICLQTSKIPLLSRLLSTGIQVRRSKK